jgi:peptide/nickel transport system permease protein
MRIPLFLGGWLVKAALILLAIVVLNFCLVRLAPGDVATVLAGESGAADPDFLARTRAEFGLDRPLPAQLATYVGNVLSLDLGVSYRTRRPVADMVLERLPATLLLTGAAFLFALVVGPALGVLAAVRARRVADSLITVAALVFYAMPIFWVGLLFILFFSVTLGWLPPFGMRSLIPPSGDLARTLDIARHLVLPALTLGLFYVAIYPADARLDAGGAQPRLRQDRARQGPAGGPSVSAHILRNACCRW